MRTKYEMINLLEHIQLLSLSFILTNKSIIRFLIVNNKEQLADLLSMSSMFICFITSIMIIIIKKLKIQDITWLICVYIIMFISQISFYTNTMILDYSYELFIIGFIGYIIGKGACNHKQLIIYLGKISFIYGIFLLLEPINGKLLNLKSMTLGYTMVPLIIYLLVYWNAYKEKKLVLILAVFMSITTILFTSRGCAISLIILYIILIITNMNYSKKIILRNSMIAILIFFSLIIGFIFIQEYLAMNPSNILNGSVLNKFSNGVLLDDNGRSEIFTQSLRLIKEHPILGVGVGAERQLLNIVFPHNIILELLLNFGLINTLILLVLYWRPIIKYLNKKLYTEEGILLIGLICSQWIRLLVSDSYLNNTLGLMFILGMSINKIQCSRRELRSYYEHF